MDPPIAPLENVDCSQFEGFVRSRSEDEEIFSLSRKEGVGIEATFMPSGSSVSPHFIG